VERIALGRVGTPADIAPMAVAILSEKYGAYMTGTTVVVDGGIALYNWLDAQG
jgi:NAD(P)-dependent dehydrogenase (short-subunit alcohol dehydrogenase family)